MGGMSIERERAGWSVQSTRLHRHPAAGKTLTGRMVWTFTCPGCGEEDFFLRHARVQPDGSLLCRWCDKTEGALSWCPTCREVKPKAEFAPVPDEYWDAMAASLGSFRVGSRECHACKAAEPPRSSHAMTCAACGTEFTSSRSDAKTCSTRCRVRLHRQQAAAVPDGTPAEAPDTEVLVGAP
jgi:hypothetical protein